MVRWENVTTQERAGEQTPGNTLGLEGSGGTTGTTRARPSPAALNLLIKIAKQRTQQLEKLWVVSESGSFRSALAPALR